MPTTITLDGTTRSGFFSRLKQRLSGDDRGNWLGDAWSDEAAAADAAMPASPVADFTTAAVGWGVLTFAVVTAGYRGWEAVQRHLPSSPVKGVHRRRRRR